MQEKVKILVVEDESIVGIDLKFTLGKLNYNVMDVVRTGEEAIEKALKENPDLVLMDIMLDGKLNGIEAANEISKKRNIPIIYLTAYADQKTLHKAKLTQPYGYILKPFDEKSLYSTIEMALYKYSIERKLKESEERYRHLIELSPVAVGILADRKVAYANNAAAKVFGTDKPEDLIGKPILDFVPQDFMQKINERIRKIFVEKEGFVGLNEKLKRIDGKLIDAEFTVIPIKYYDKSAAQIIIRNITEEKKRNKVQQTVIKILETSDTSGNLDELFSSIHSIIEDYLPIKNFLVAICDEENQTISFPYYADELDLKPTERKFSNGLIEFVLKNDSSLLVTEEEIKKMVDEGIVEVFNKMAKSWLGVPLKIKGKKIGVIVVKEYSVKGLITETEKELLELVAFPISRAIERKLLEEEQKKINEKLRDMNETKDKFFSIISHDLRSPFESILGFTEILKNEFDQLDKRDVHLFIDSLYESSRHVFKILNNLLEYSRFQLGKFEYASKPIILNELVEKNLQALKGMAIKKSISLNNNINKRISVLADENMLNSVILNLTTNAIKFTNTGGFVNIFTKNYENFTEVFIEDNGIGMDDNIIQNLFKLGNNYSRNGTAKETGSGLGLLLSKDFIEKNGGKISVKSAPGKGSCFKFTLPVVKN